jgi:uncharacterized protein YbbK (DUF523 family)
MKSKPVLGISACLLGNAVRYDGGHKFDEVVVQALERHFKFIAVCPETGCGMTVPRDPMRLQGDPASPRLITTTGRADKTEQMERWTQTFITELEKENLAGFIFKSKSPSCGLDIAVYDSGDRVVQKTMGLFARSFTRRFPSLPVTEAEALHDAAFREKFILGMKTIKES